MSTNGKAYKRADIRNKGTEKTGKDKLCFSFHPNGTKLSDTEIKRLVDGGMKAPPFQTSGAGSKRQQTKHGEKIQILAAYTTTKDG